MCESDPTQVLVCVTSGIAVHFSSLRHESERSANDRKGSLRGGRRIIHDFCDSRYFTRDQEKGMREKEDTSPDVRSDSTTRLFPQSVDA